MVLELWTIVDGEETVDLPTPEVGSASSTPAATQTAKGTPDSATAPSVPIQVVPEARVDAANTFHVREQQEKLITFLTLGDVPASQVQDCSTAHEA